MNSYSCNGNLTRDPEEVKFSSGNKITKFGIAVNGRVKKENGEVVKDASGRTVREVVFWDCKIWGDAGNAIMEYSHKGDKIGLVGAVEDESWDDKTTGEKRTKKVLVVKEYEFLGGGQNQGSEGGDDTPKSAGKTPARGRPKKEKTSAPDNTSDVVEDVNSIPF